MRHWNLCPPDAMSTSFILISCGGDTGVSVVADVAAVAALATPLVREGGGVGGGSARTGTTRFGALLGLAGGVGGRRGTD